VPHTTAKTGTTTSITGVNPEPSVVGQSVTVQYAVTPSGAGPALTGHVTVSDGITSCTATIAAGQCALLFTGAGDYNLMATYAGDSNYGSSGSSGQEHTVDAAATTTTITSAVPNPSTQGHAVTVSYTVAVDSPGAGTPTGSVSVSDGADSCVGTVAAGKCSITLTTSGKRTLVATYGGDANFLGSVSKGVDQNVGSPSPPTATVASGTCKGVVASGTVTFSLFDAGGNPMTFTLATDSNPSLVPSANVVLSGHGNVRTLAVAASHNKTGTATLTFHLSDGTGTGTVPVVETVIVGDAPHEHLNGTAGADLMFGLGAGSVVNGNAGNDVLCAGNGGDTLNGGDGNDWLWGGNGNDTLYGGNGNDALLGGNGNDILYGGNGNDFLLGGNGNDSEYGQNGIDALLGGNGNDILNGGNGNDVMFGQAGNDTLTGGPGADYFSGGPGIDVATDFNPAQGDTTDGTIP
jgi:Ca2+-binding RTX toxin-like protein